MVGVVGVRTKFFHCFGILLRGAGELRRGAWAHPHAEGRQSTPGSLWSHAAIERDVVANGLEVTVVAAVHDFVWHYKRVWKA
jgi:hypothetical protein